MPNNFRVGIRLSLLVLLMPCVCAALPRARGRLQQGPARSTPNQNGNDAATQSCLEAGKQVLGSDAEVLKCGHLTGTDALEDVAVIRLKRFRTNAEGIPVSKLVILRQGKSGWGTELTVDRFAQNQAGYVGIDFIDDSPSFARNIVGYRVSFSNQIAEGKPGFAMVLGYLRSDGNLEGIGYEVAWNPSVGRFQEFDDTTEPPVFKPEIKNPPHKFGRKSQG